MEDLVMRQTHNTNPHMLSVVKVMESIHQVTLFTSLPMGLLQSIMNPVGCGHTQDTKHNHYEESSLTFPPPLAS